jgi:hypothetical protein
MTILAVGSSSAGVFKVFQDSHVLRIGGSTMKGFTRPSGESRLLFDKFMKKHRNSGASCICFQFGTVDHILSYYHNLIYNDVVVFDPENYVREYVKYIASIDFPGIKAIMTPLPPVVKNDNVAGMLMVYGITSWNDIKEFGVTFFHSVSTRQERLARFDVFVDLLEEYCQKYGVHFINAEWLLRKDGRVKEEYIDQYSDFNLHVAWEPQAKHLKKRLEEIGYNAIIRKDLMETLEVYKNEKKKTREELIGLDYDNWTTRDVYERERARKEMIALNSGES